MSLANIISAIKAQADNEVSDIREKASRECDEYSKKTNEAVSEFRSSLAAKTSRCGEQMKRRARTRIGMYKKELLLKEKHAALDDVYSSVLSEVKNLPREKLDKLEKSLEKRVGHKNGNMRKSKDGGFVFVSENFEEDFTFTHLVHEVLRPSTELGVASKLFS